MEGLLSALRTLTILPLPGRSRGDLASAVPWFPAAGLAMGLVLAAAAGLWAALVPHWPEGGGAFLLAAGVFLTGGLHLDGLADWADALGASRDKDRRLAVMKDSRVGAFGVLALGLLMIAKWTALARILEAGAVLFLPVPMIASRWLMAELTATLPSAREGDGTAGPFILGATPRRRFAAAALGLGLCLPWGLTGAGPFGLAWAAGAAFRRHCRRGFGGVTGDLLGAGGEMVETLLLFAICALPADTLLWYTVPGGWR